MMLSCISEIGVVWGRLPSRVSRKIVNTLWSVRQTFPYLLSTLHCMPVIQSFSRMSSTFCPVYNLVGGRQQCRRANFSNAAIERKSDKSCCHIAKMQIDRPTVTMVWRMLDIHLVHRQGDEHHMRSLTNCRGKRFVFKGLAMGCVWRMTFVIRYRAEMSNAFNHNGEKLPTRLFQRSISSVGSEEEKLRPLCHTTANRNRIVITQRGTRERSNENRYRGPRQRYMDNSEEPNGHSKDPKWHRNDRKCKPPEIPEHPVGHQRGYGGPYSSGDDESTRDNNRESPERPQENKKRVNK